LTVTGSNFRRIAAALRRGGVIERPPLSEEVIMRPNWILLVLPIAVAACGSETPPPSPPVVINTTPAPTFTASVPVPSSSGLVNQCQGLFAQALGGQAVNYAAPAVTTAGDATIVHLAARIVTAPPGTVTQYSCNFTGGTLTGAGMN
jgi:hypothetical protein